MLSFMALGMFSSDGYVIFVLFVLQTLAVLTNTHNVCSEKKCAPQNPYFPVQSGFQGLLIAWAYLCNDRTKLYTVLHLSDLKISAV